MKKLVIIGLSIIIAMASCTKEKTVEKKIILASELSLDKVSASIIEGQSIQLNASILPEDTSNKTILWESTNVKIASVDAKGLVTSHQVGEVEITANTGDLTKQCNITVTKNVILLTSIEFKDAVTTMEIGKAQILKVTLNPENASYQDITWTNTKPEVISNDENVLIALSAGTTTITASTSEGITKSITITVSDPDACIDANGREYKTVKIGNQLWTAENFAYLPKISNLNALYVEPNFYVYGYEGFDIDEAKETENYKKHGVLYNYRAAKVSAPKGWHMPSEEEWKELELTLGLPVEKLTTMYWRGTNEYANKFKATEGWSVAGTNESGLSIIPSGRMTRGAFSYIDKAVLFWSSTLHSEDDTNAYVYGRMFQENRTGVNRAKINEAYAISVRYVRDK